MRASGAQAAWLPDGRRLHLHHGPIDLILGWDGPGRAEAFGRAEARFASVLDELVPDLPRLRAAARAQTVFDGAIQRRMQAAVAPLLPGFVTPMAAVAGSVADEILAAMAPGPEVARAFVNNGGDIALHLGPGARLTLAIASATGGRVTIDEASPVRGVATSGAGGRSHSLGIAEAVTVLAADAAAADAAATLIANEVDCPGHPAVSRRPAAELSPDSDLGHRLVTVAVGSLDRAARDAALQSGAAYAQALCGRQLIAAAHLSLQGAQCSVSAQTAQLEVIAD